MAHAVGAGRSASNDDVSTARTFVAVDLLVALNFTLKSVKIPIWAGQAGQFSGSSRIIFNFQEFRNPLASLLRVKRALTN
jgi:hypothetical protein